MSRRNDRGATYLEALIALILLSIAVASLTAFFLPAVKVQEKSDAIAEDSAGFFSAYYHIRDGINQVHPPWTERSLSIPEGPDRFAFSWYGGVEGDQFILENRGSDLLIITLTGGEKRILRRIGGMGVREIRPLEKNGAPYALDIILRIRGDRTKRIIIPMAVIPLERMP